MNRGTRQGLLLAGVFLIGVVAAGAFAATVQYTNRLAFCIGCREMESTVYQEYRQTIRFSNRSAFRPPAPTATSPITTSSQPCGAR